jgi:hypothetical protein
VLENFYRDVLPETGNYCLFTLHDGAHVWADSIERLVARTETRMDMPGVYFATASYLTTHNRKGFNVHLLRSLRLDIDVAKEKDPQRLRCYDTRKEALAAIVGFLKAADLPPTYIVSSGKGFHVYWCLDTDITPEQWQPLADGLQARGEHLGLKIDSACTTDRTRILRPPGTIHHDDVRVSIIQSSGHIWNVAHLRDRLVSADAADSAPVELTPTRTYDTSINREAIIEVVRRPPVSAYDIAAKCAALHEVAVKGGDVPEPFWRAMLGLVKHTIEGEDLAHEWSMGHPNYDPDETQQKLDRWTAGPTRCTEFANHTDACKTCIYRGKYTSPVLLVNPPAPAVAEPQVTAITASAAAPAAPTVPPTRPALIVGQPWEGRIPEGFSVVPEKKGGYTLVARMESEDADTGQPTIKLVPITHDIFWLGQWAGAENSDDSARATLHLMTAEGVKSYVFEQHVISSIPKLIEFCTDKAIIPTNHKSAGQAMQNLFRAALHHVKATHKRQQITDHLGLRIQPNGDLIATQGEYTIFKDGHIEQSMIASPLRGVARQFGINLPDPDMEGEWSPKVWESIEPLAKEHVAFLQKYYGGPGMERFQVAIMMGLASPFMPFVTGGFQRGATLPRGGLSVSLFSRESARGKTTAVMSAILAYGSPADLTNDSGKSGSTDIARIRRLEIHGTLPNIMDEMGSNAPASVASVVSSVGNGGSREVAKREGGLTISAPWALINLITTNTSQRDMIVAVQESSDAIQQRLLEINVEGVPEYDRKTREQFTYDWASVTRKCVGALGAMVHREIVKMGLDAATELAMRCSAKADTLLNANQSARFQYRGLGALLALHLTLAKIGIEIFPLKGVVDAFKVAYNAGQDFIVSNVMPTDGLELLSRMLHDFKPTMLVTRGLGRLDPRYPDREDTVLNDSGRVPQQVLARHFHDESLTVVVADAMKTWCKDKGVSEQEIIKKARTTGVLKLHGERSLPSERMRLFRGLKIDDTNPVRCYYFHTQKLAHALGLPVAEVVPAGTAPASNVVPMHAA